MKWDNKKRKVKDCFPLPLGVEYKSKIGYLLLSVSFDAKPKQ